MANTTPMSSHKSAGAAALAEAVFPRIRIGRLAKALAVDPETVRRWARGQASPPAAKLAQLEDLLDIPMRSWAEPLPSEAEVAVDDEDE